MVRSRPSWLCSVWHIASTWALGVTDCFRRSRSSSKNSPAERRLKNATPNSHVSTSQGRASSDEDRLDKLDPENLDLENLDEVTTTLTSRLVISRASRTGEDFASVAVLEGVRRKNVAIGATNITASAATLTL